MSYQTTLSFDSVVVIESLPEDELWSGTELFEDTIQPAWFADPTFVVELYQPQSRREFQETLETIAGLVAEHSSSPILHLETHGSSSGMRFADGSRMTWDEVAGPLAEINRRTRMNLLVFAGLCHGWSMIEILRPTRRAPVFGMIGPMETVEAGRLLSATKLMYERLLEPDHDLRAALNSANGSTSVEDWEFRWMSAELMFCRIFEDYVKDVSREHVRSERLNRLVADLARVKALDVQETMQLRVALSADLDNHQAWFSHYREHFLLLDLFPGNEPRFQLSYSDCVRDKVRGSAL